MALLGAGFMMRSPPSFLQDDPFADASIGNIMGSNSVNVFLGLGLPWLIGSIYWAVAGTNSPGYGKWQVRPLASVSFVICLGDLQIALGGGETDARRRSWGGGVGEMGFHALPFVLWKNGCWRQRRWNTKF